MKNILVIIFSMVIYGCVSEITKEGSLVQQASANRVADCTHVGTFNQKNDPNISWIPSSHRESAMINMKNRVAAAGGTHMVILGKSYSWWDSEYEFVAEAYRCK